MRPVVTEAVVVEEAEELREVDVRDARVVADDDRVLVVLLRRVVAVVRAAGDERRVLRVESTRMIFEWMRIPPRWPGVCSRRNWSGALVSRPVAVKSRARSRL
jgi:hypothetical protein